MIDFIIHLPLTPQGFDAIIVIIDRFTKRVYFIPSKSTDIAEDFANLLLREVIRHHGIPTEIISDRDTRFISRFWTATAKMLGIERHLSSSYHPQSDDQIECTNQILQNILRNYIRYNQSDWDIWLFIVEYIYNDTRHSSIGMTPFYADYARKISPMIRQIKDETNVESANKLAKKLVKLINIISTNIIQTIQR